MSCISPSGEDRTAALQAQVTRCFEQGRPLRVIGGNSKAFIGRATTNEPLEALHVSGHRGIVSYEPSELVVSVRAGTPLAELESELGARGQQLAFEPPHFADAATVGGTIACALSGPARPYAGAARDFVLGTRIVNGRGDELRFGGEVMKNVAGYDISRLMTGALGTLGVLLEISLKVLPKPARVLTLRFTGDQRFALEKMNAWSCQPLPVSATAYYDRALYVRLSGTCSGVESSSARLGGARLADGAAFWEAIKEQKHDFFRSSDPLWRLSLPAHAPPLERGALAGEPCLVEWGGALRWVRSARPASEVRAAAAALSGHAALFRGGDRSGAVAAPLSPGIAALHARLKQAFDPKGILNPGRLYREP